MIIDPGSNFHRSLSTVSIAWSRKGGEAACGTFGWSDRNSCGQIEGVIVKASEALFGLSREFGRHGEVVSPGQIIQGAGDIVQQGDDNLLSRSGQDHESDGMVMAGE